MQKHSTFYGGGGSIDNCTSDKCGGGRGGSVDEEARDTCEGEGGGGRSMVNTSGLRGGVGRKRSMGRSLSPASIDACGKKMK